MDGSVYCIKSGFIQNGTAERFAETVGMPPMQYVNHLRMNIAGDMLRSDNSDINEISAKVGYESHISFSRAFKQFWGKPPGFFRRNPQAGKAFDLK
jgi:AraC-like DNA-binding protein